MPKQSDIKSILIIGAGPIIIGQACEFDYAGTQACKALKAEGYRIILVNSNPATIMTDPEIADATYIEPLTLEFLEKIIIQEKPDALLPTLGGQTALNCALQLSQSGILEKYHIKLIGASINAIELAENRYLFQQLMKKIGLETPHSIKVTHLDQIKNLLKNDSILPVIVRPSFTLGGSGAGIATTAEELIQLCQNAFALSPLQEIMLDEALIGWKEFELEVIRDKKDNCIIVCGIENIDPLGIHTGDSITVAPIQTLTDKEYQSMRQAAFKILRAVGVETGGSNVQFAVHPATGKMVVIEMNPRVSRSSALVSKASGYPIAKIAAKLAVGYTLDELKNDITTALPASFEPSLDYVVVKIPKFNFEKFPGTEKILGAQMQSVGEVMSIGRTFAEALQKAIASVGLDENDIPKFLEKADPWFLNNMLKVLETEKQIATLNIQQLTKDTLKTYKKMGFSDARLATLLNCSLDEILSARKKWDIYPVYKRVDSCAGEFSTPTAYLYSTYEQVCEANVTTRKKMLVIGSGANRIGQGIEFDYCCVHAIKALKLCGYETIMVNCNPETVSTDFDVVDRLYCSPLTLEHVLDIIHLEKPEGVFVQYGGQTPLHLAEGLAKAGVNLIGLPFATIQQTEDRYEFQQLIQQLNLNQPKNHCINSLKEAESAANDIGFPLIIRPSFVLGGAAMQIVNTMQQLHDYLAKQQNHQSILIEQFLQNAMEIDVDAITDGEEIFIPALLEHIEPAGVHSGDSACITPTIHLSDTMQTEIKKQIQQLASAMSLKGVFNVQFALQNDAIYILEVNPRASRTLPFLCKATGLPLIQMATWCALGKKLKDLNIPQEVALNFYYVKEAVLPFIKFPKSPALLGPEMKSTGEVMGVGLSPMEAYAKAQIAAGNHLPKGGNAYLSTPDESIAKKLTDIGFNITTVLSEKCSLIVAINDLVSPTQETLNTINFAIQKNICYVTTLPAALKLIDAIKHYAKNHYSVIPLQKINQEKNHFLTGMELSSKDIQSILDNALQLKQERENGILRNDLQGLHLALLFDKPSLRTRFSFTLAMRELGGEVIESVASTRKSELPEDQARVLSGYCHAIMLRTHDDTILEKMSASSTIPVINGLSDLHHPCQILADLLTLFETFGSLKNKTLAYIGDGNNILHSLLLIAPALGVNIHYCCPPTRIPNDIILQKSLSRLHENTGTIQFFSTPELAVKNADAVYTDVWTSMGFENQAEEYLFDGFQVNETLMQHAKKQAVFMHCLPMERGKEVNDTLPDQACSVIFQQSENRLHVQKALLLFFLSCQRMLASRFFSAKFSN